jgi:hypothetical protein
LPRHAVHNTGAEPPRAIELVATKALTMRTFGVILTAFLLAAASRPPDIAFRAQMIDPGYSETAAVADINQDGRLDIVSGEYWYEAPSWRRHPIREINYTNGYIDNFSDLVVMDVDGDGYPDIIQFGYFSQNIVCLKIRRRAAAGG